MKYDNILGTVGNTPVIRINRLAPEGINLYVKCEYFNPLSSVKDRLALGVIEAAEKSGDLKPGQTVVDEHRHLRVPGSHPCVSKPRTSCEGCTR